MQSDATTPQEYIVSLPEDRREAISTVREVILANLPAGYVEGMFYGMIGYFVPLDRIPMKTKIPLGYVALASQKNYMAIYLMSKCFSDDGDDWFRNEYKATGKRLDMGKGCVRFRRLEDLPLDLVARAVAAVPYEDLIAHYEASQT